MLLGIVSDTHGSVHGALKAARMFESLAVEAVIHCGDIGSAEIAPLFSAWPAHFVLGNVDRDEAALRASIERAGLTLHGRFGEIELAGVKIAFLHGDDLPRLRQTIASGQWRLVCSGHTHKPERQQEGDVLALNPGAVYRANPHTVAVVELPACKATIIEI